jgi:hypothetical protein
MSLRILETEKFLTSRAKEIEFFQNALKTKGAFKNNLPGQRCPKHQRRRSMSYNRKRIPSRIRPKD